MHATARFTTDQAERYLVSLCTHFARKVPVTQEPQTGRVEFPFGHCAFHANAHALTMEASAPDASALHDVTEIITRHLERFAFRENPILTWHTAP